MKCREVRKLAYLYREAEIPEEIRRQIVQHAASCQRCAYELRQASITGLTIADMRGAEPRLHAQRDLTEQIMRGIGMAKAGEARSRPRPIGLSFRRLQFACTLTAAIIVAAFLVQNGIDVYRMAALESRLDQGPPAFLSATVEEPRLAAMGLSTIAQLGRMLSRPPETTHDLGLRDRRQLRDAVSSFFDVVEGGPPGFAGEVQRLRAKYPDVWLISPLDGLTPHDRLVLSRQGKSLMNDLRTLLQPGRSDNEK